MTCGATTYSPIYAHHVAGDPLPAGDNADAFNFSRTQFQACRECEPGESIEILSIGLFGGDILDYSNSHALIARAELWYPWVHVHNGASTAACMTIADMEDVPSDIVADVVQFRENFGDYPVIDEDDYSRREYEEFCETFDYKSSLLDDLTTGDALDQTHPSYDHAIEYAIECYLGYSDPGYVSREHVIESWRAAGVEIEAES